MKPLAIVSSLLLGLVIIYFTFYPTTSYRFRITVNVDTPQGLKSGSSVMQVRDWRYPSWVTFGEISGGSSLKGEAVFVDLGPDGDGKSRNLIALLALGPFGQDPNFYLVPGQAFEPLWRQKLRSPEFHGSSWELSNLPVGTKTELSDNILPTLVTFSNVADSRTAAIIQPNKFESTFGSGFRLQNVTIEIVSNGIWPLSLLGLSGEPMIPAIKAQLPFLTLENERLRHVMYDMPPRFQPSLTSFVR